MAIDYSVPKDPQAQLDYTFNWSQWLPGGSTIASVIWTIPAGITQIASSFTNTTATVWVSGGTVGTTYTVTCRITTNAATPLIDERSVTLVVEQR